MCGILGYIHNESAISRPIFNKMLATLKQRGPDGQGSIYLKNEQTALGHTRLSIIDLSEAGSQPMTNEDASVWLTFNGEIYNYQELRQTLEKHGHIFRSHSDSETIIHAYEEWGTDCVNYFRGIFAFGIYDCRDNSLFLARDHFGVKPLYYYRDSKRLIFASQPRAILVADDFKVELDKTGFSLYLGYGNVPAEYSIYQNIQKLLPGHFLLLKQDKIIIKQYWKIEYKPVIKDLSEAVDLVREKIENSIYSQAVSDVPIGTLLSGGIDSTIVTSLLARDCSQQLSSFTMGFLEEESDERRYAQLVAETLQTNHYEKVLTYSNACNLLSHIVEAYDEPFHFNGLFPFYALSQLVQSQGTKVVLGGDGADEIFAGYLWYENFIKDCNYQPNPSVFTTLIKQIKQNLNLIKNNDPVKTFFTYNGFLNPSEQNKLLGSEIQSLDEARFYEPLTRHWNPELNPVLGGQLLDINCFLVDHCLTKVDRASMACGVEVRVPFLDIELVELVFSIDHNLIFFNDERKAMLKKSMSQMLPGKMDKHRKKGFSSPLSKWLDQGLAKAGYSLLLNGSLCDNGFLNTVAIQELFPVLGSGNQLLLIAAELWFQRWINNNINIVEDFIQSSLAISI